MGCGGDPSTSSGRQKYIVKVLQNVMLPWIESRTLSLGLLTLQTWGVFVAASILAATWLAAKRATAKGLDPNVIWSAAGWMFLSAMVGSRLFHVFLYEPMYYWAHPWEAIDPRQPGFAIMGGIALGAAAGWIYARKHGLDVVAYADVIAWGVPWGCGIGRIGCFLIHDHPGTLTSFALGVKYPDGLVRHDLGLYLSLVGFSIGLIFLVLNRKSRRAGFWVGMFLILDGLLRFALDFFRIADRRIIGLTPTQWLLIASVGVGIWLVRRRSA